MAKEVVVKAEKIYGRKKKYSKVKIMLTISLFVLTLAFIILSVIYKGGKFTITLDSRLARENQIVIYENSQIPEETIKLETKDMEFMDNISINWIPQNIDTEQDGSHNGENYIAYTFYIKNKGTETINYWYAIKIDDVIKKVDEAARVMVFLNGEKKVYAKINSITQLPEKDTIPFFSASIPVLEQRKNFKPNDVDKFTIVIWLEGDDPDCIDNILGGEIKMHMEIREEFKEENNG
ncbi:MAG: hypothetical protein MRZ35_01075 [Firmicutes bacterium]|nr:hypothetical protein [Bacillota bacterium]